MIVTEEEAKTKWCPEATVGGTLPERETANRWTQVIADGKAVEAGAGCIGSACMAWRWDRNDRLETIGNSNMVRRIDHGGDYSTTHGYCGKAGKP